MAWDYRKYYGWQNHPKFLAVREEYGVEGMMAVDILWGYAAEYRHKGVLYGMSREAICRACQLESKKTEFVDFLHEQRLLDLPDDAQLEELLGHACEGGGATYYIHNWRERQPNCFFRDDIKERKKHAANVRWDQEKRKKPRRTSRKTKAASGDAGEDAGCNARALRQQCPNPTQPNQEKDSLSTLSQATEASEGERARDYFAGLVREALPGASLKAPQKWVEMLDGLLDQLFVQHRSKDELRSVMQWALQHEFWRTRILTPKSFMDNYVKVRGQMQQETDGMKIDDCPQNGKPMTAKEWESLKRQRKEGKENGTTEPP